LYNFFHSLFPGIRIRRYIPAAAGKYCESRKERGRDLLKMQMKRETREPENIRCPIARQYIHVSRAELRFSLYTRWEYFSQKSHPRLKENLPEQ
jgi:hypothetical protein